MQTANEARILARFTARMERFCLRKVDCRMTHCLQFNESTRRAGRHECRGGSEGQELLNSQTSSRFESEGALGFGGAEEQCMSSDSDCQRGTPTLQSPSEGSATETNDISFHSTSSIVHPRLTRRNTGSTELGAEGDDTVCRRAQRRPLTAF